MTSPNFSAIRARLRYESLDDFMAGYTPFISKGGMFVPMAPSKLKPVGTTVRFQFLLQDGTTAMLGEGVVRQIQGINSGDNSPVGMLVKFTRLNRDSKNIVAQILARKKAAQASTEPDSKSSAAPTSDDTPAPQPSSQAHRAENTVEFDSDVSESQDEDDSSEYGLDNLFLAPTDEPAATSDSTQQAPAATEDAAAFDLGDFEFDMDSNASTAGLDASGSDVFGESEPSIQSAGPAEPAAATERSEGPKQLGSTEAGLQIMAFDAVSDDEAAGLADLDFGGDEGDVDQMFDDIFGGGGFFGGGEDDAPDESLFGGDFELEADDSAEPDQPPITIGATAHDGGELLHPDAQLVDEDFAEELADEELAEELDDDEFVLNEVAQLDDALSSDDELFSDDDDPSSDDIDFIEEHSALVNDDEVEDAEELLEWDDESEAGEDVDFELAEEFEEPEQPAPPSEEIEVPAPSEAGLAQESSAPSADLLSVLGTLDADDAAPDLKSITLGSGAGVAAVTDNRHDEDEDEDSLSALLAKAQHEIESKREAEQSEDNTPGDIFDDLLGDQGQLPPPPRIQPVFDIADAEGVKKKKGGFMSKLFGKE